VSTLRFPRSSGILLHPTSLPGRFGIGDLGPAASAFLDFLGAAGQRLWQVLPLGPTGYGDSPYQCFSAFAGNPLLVSPERMVEAGLLPADALADVPAFPSDQVDFGAVIPWKRALLDRAAAAFAANADAAGRERYDAWCAHHAGWLDDFALFMALKDAHGGASWADWAPPLRRREPAALTAARKEHAARIHAHRFAQWVFFEQWAAVRVLAQGKGVAIMGDAPIFVAYDSADVWSRPDLFQLDADGRPTAVAGVPPDYFSETGQLWRNPLYRWDVLGSQGYRWWIERVRSLLELVDRVRLDHFIGFTRCWAVPAGASDAREGHFQPGPGEALFEALIAAIGELPIVAEDLGVVTPEVEALRDRYAFPGMKILQFAFGGTATSGFLPHAYTRNCVVYSGTHDNDTTAGWWASAAESERDFLRRYLDRDVADPAWALLRLASASVADTCVVPAQDLLGLGTGARMNFPSRASGNWSWRVREGTLDEPLARRLREVTELYGRLPE
jgi:4-alpha-glucanotransferase